MTSNLVLAMVRHQNLRLQSLAQDVSTVLLPYQKQRSLLGTVKQTKRLTTNGIMQMVIEGAYHIRAENSNAIKFYLCPRYDGGNYDSVLLFTVLNALSGLSPMRDREAAWEALNMRTGSGPADWDVTQILYYSSHYTLLTIDVDGTFTESHYHFILDGQTEQT